MELPVARTPVGTRRGRRPWALLAGLALVAMALTALALRGGAPDARDTSATATRAPWSWRAGEVRVYGIELSYDATIELPTATSAQASYARVTGRLELRIAEALDDGRAARVELGLSRLRYERDGQLDRLAATAMSAPFSARVDATGAFDDFRFAPALAAQERSELTDLVRLFQIVVPASADASWQTVEGHAMGRFEAVYAREPEGTIHKQKVRYLETTPMTRSLGDLMVVRSDVRARSTRGALWLDTVSVEDEVRVGPADKPRIHVVVRARLGAVDEAIDASPPPSTGATSAIASDLRRDRGTPTSASDLAALLGRLRGSGAGPAEIRDLAVLLGRSPKLAAEFSIHLRDAEFPEASAGVVIDALGFVASPEAQSALMEVMLDPDAPATRRRRALIVLGGVEHPTDQALDRTWRLWSEPANPPTADLAPPAALAIGRMADRLREADPSRYASTRDRLVLELHAARETARTVVVLKALGNVSDPELTSVVAPYLASEDPLVRAAAADTLGLFGGPQAISQLTARLGVEPTDWVRQKLADSLLGIAELPATSLGFLARHLATETHEGARLVIARIVARSAPTDPDARAALERLLVNETSEAIRAFVTEALAPPPQSRAR